MTNEQLTLSIAEMDSKDERPDPQAYSLELLRRQYPELEFLFNEVSNLRDDVLNLPTQEKIDELEDDLHMWRRDFHSTDLCLTEIAVLVDEVGSPMLHEAVQEKLEELGKATGR